MLFNVERDEGTRVVAYVVPDAGGTTPSIVVSSGGRALLELAANDRHQHLVDVGRHATGQCGFVIDETLVPGLAETVDLEIVEATSGLLVYRRRPPATLDHRIFRLETHLLPLSRLDDGLKDRFQSWYKGIDRYGRETSTQVFCMNGTSSSYVSGRLLYRNYETHLSRGVTSVTVLRDPYHELAERLLLLKTIGSRASDILGPRDAISFQPVIEALAEYEDFGDAFRKRFFRKAPRQILAALSNPLVRLLTAQTPDEQAGHQSVAAALDALAGFEIIGRRSDTPGFSHDLAQWLEVDTRTIPVVPEYPRIVRLGECLRRIHDVEALLEKDLEVFHLIARAFETAAA